MPTPDHPEQPVSVSAGCARAILAGTKTMLRVPAAAVAEACPFGGPGDLLWVREPWAWADASAGRVRFRADAGPGEEAGWLPARELPRTHSRATLRIRSVHPERLRAAPDADLLAEGALWREDVALAALSPREGFAAWWDSLHPRPGTRWADDPLVWVVAFALATPGAGGAVRATVGGNDIPGDAPPTAARPPHPEPRTP